MKIKFKEEILTKFLINENANKKFTFFFSLFLRISQILNTIFIY